jgi:formylglycine-generating enzyme required for sulfatase activity
MRGTSVAILLAGLVFGAAAADSGWAAEKYALLVGVEQYRKGELRSLDFTENDVTDLAEVLLTSGYPEENVVLLTNAHADAAEDYRFQPIADNIRDELDLVLREVRAGDSVLVAFSGHGVQFADDPSPYFCPSDARLNDKETLIALDEVYHALAESPAAMRLLFVDACRNDPFGGATASADRGAVDLAPSGLGLPAVEEGGVVAMVSCSPSERSFESPELGHGVFFHYLIEGLRGQADLAAPGEEADGEVTLTELEEYAVRNTQKFARTKLGVAQTPQRKGDVQGSLALAIVPREPAIPAGPEPLVAPFDAAEARAGQEAWARSLNLPVVEKNSIGMTLVLIPPGDFQMGGEEDALSVLRRFPESKPDDLNGEYPQHPVRLTRPFRLSAHEVTLGQFLKFYHAAKYKAECVRDGKGGEGWTGSEFEDRRSYVPWDWGHKSQTYNHPVVNVTWNDAAAFCRWLSEKEGRTYRLPVETEWEYACRAGTTSRFSFGNDPEDLVVYANTADQSEKKLWDNPSDTYPWLRGDDGHALSAPVGSYVPNAFGLYDMHGNVDEWCGDWSRVYPETNGEVQIDPLIPENRPSAKYRAFRGSSFFNKAVFSRSAARFWTEPSTRKCSRGFRIVCETAMQAAHEAPIPPDA